MTSPQRKALFLDRDGVINVDGDYVHRKKDFVFIDGIFDLCRMALAKDYLVIVITNQSGIGRGLYTEADFQKLTTWMHEEFAREKAPLTAVYHCPHAPGDGCYCRKPKPGMLMAAQREWNIDMAHSIFIGNMETDIKAGRGAKVGRNVLLGKDVESLAEVIPSL